MQNDLASASPSEPVWRDHTICPPGCSARDYAHIHCQSYGCIMYGQGGAGDDGRGIDAYVDDDGRESITCQECGLEVCPRCIQRLDNKVRCFECASGALVRSMKRATEITRLAS